MRTLLNCVVAVLIASPAAALQTDWESYARALLDNAFARTGDDQQALADALELLRTEPEHPLSAAALRLLHSRSELASDPPDYAQRVLSIDPSGFDSAAQRQWSILSGSLTRRAEPATSDQDCFGDFLRHFFVIGPIGSRLSVRPWDRPTPLLLEPGFGQEHAGVDDPVVWVALERPGTTRFVLPREAVQRNFGTCVLASVFELPESVAAFIEIETGFPAEGVNQGDGFRAVVAGYEVALNEASLARVDFGRERPLTWRAPVTLRAGRNRLLIRSSLQRAARGQFAVRLLGSDGRPLHGVTEVEELPQSDALGAPSTAAAPAGEWSDALTRLAQPAAAGPFCEALLGALLVTNQQTNAGMLHLENALARVPDEECLKVSYAMALAGAEYLPRVWRAGRARKLAEEVVAANPEHYAMQLYLADVYGREDQEEQALTTLLALVRAHPRTVQPRLGLAAAYRALGMDAQAERQLFRALKLAPRHPTVLTGVIEHYARSGLQRKAAEYAEQLANSSGNRPNQLAEAALRHVAAGDVDAARRLFEAAYASDRAFVWRYVDFLTQVEDWERVAELVDDVLEHFPRSLSAWRERADLARRAGDELAELAALRRIAELDPSQTSNSERLHARTGNEAEQVFFAAQLANVADVIQAYVEGEREDSLVSLLDHGIIYVHADGSWSQVTQNVYQVRDLEACNAMGKLELPGDVIAVATIKAADGARHEPVLVNGEYVMPSLEPGDFIETTYRTVQAARGDGKLRLGGWFFASTEQAFDRSRYVVNLPVDHEQRIALHNLEGIEHRVTTDAGRELHVFEALRQSRVLPEPSSPPPDWYLPAVRFGDDDDDTLMFAYLQAEAEWYSAVTFEVEREARRVTQSAAGQTAAAQALHVFVESVLDRRSTSLESATQALIAREGNATFLYMALLAAVGIERELVWSRVATPASDPEPQPDFRRMERWRGFPLVVVRPDDGPEAWCDMSLRLLPYGVASGRAPGAEAVASGRATFVTTPDLALEQRPSPVRTVEFQIAEDGAAQVAERTDLQAALGFQLKEQLRNIPDQQRSLAIRQMSARAIPGIELSDFDLPGLASSDQPVAIVIAGNVPRFLDRRAAGYVCESPISALQMRARFGTEGQRRLPFFLAAPLIDDSTARIVLPPNLTLSERPESVELDCPGGSYALQVEQAEDGVWLLRRRVAIDSFALPPSEYTAFMDFCAKIDRIESMRLGFSVTE